MMRIFIIQVHDPVIHLKVDEEQEAITRGGKRQAERTGFLAPLLVRALLLYVTVSVSGTSCVQLHYLVFTILYF